MGDGPRDWSPRGYWDDHSSGSGTRPSWATASAIAVRPRRSAMGLLALLVGSTALLVMLLASATVSRTGFVWTTAGLTAIYFGVHHFSRRRRGLASGALMASLGIAFGAAATLLSIWGMLAFSYPALPTPPHIAFAQLPAPMAATAPSVGPTGEAGAAPVAQR
jgi:hypothetical protein